MFKSGGQDGDELAYGRGVPPAHHVVWKRWSGKMPELDSDDFDIEADRIEELMELSWLWLSRYSMHGQFGG